MNATATPTAAQIIAGYKQLIARARAHDLKVIGATLLPYEGARYYRPEGDVIRQEVNQWIRTSGAFDGVIDFDAVMRDPANPKRLKADQQSGDWLHPNDAGYRVMGEAVDLRLFR
jgi:lysophospholipase L1-like esterase